MISFFSFAFAASSVALWVQREQRQKNVKKKKTTPNLFFPHFLMRCPPLRDQARAQTPRIMSPRQDKTHTRETRRHRVASLFFLFLCVNPYPDGCAIALFFLLLAARHDNNKRSEKRKGTYAQPINPILAKFLVPRSLETPGKEKRDRKTHARGGTGLRANLGLALAAERTMEAGPTRTRRALKSHWSSPTLPDAALACILVDHLPDHHRRVAALACARWRRIVLAATVANGGSALDLRIDGHTQGLLARDGCLDVLTWVAERMPRGDAHWYPIVRGAASGGRLAILDWAVTEVPRAYLDGALPFVSAAAAGHIGVLKGLYARGFDDLSGPAACTAAVDGGHLACAEWLLARGAPLDYQAACERAATAGDVNVLAWLCALTQDESNGNYDWDPLGLVALAPNTTVSQWLLEHARMDAIHARRRRQHPQGARRLSVDVVSHIW